MEAWIGLTIAAAFFQNLRSSLQKSLQKELGTNGATFVRFLFGAPIALVFFATWLLVSPEPMPSPNAGFALWALIGGTAQIGATAALLSSFRERNFAAGTAYSKTETLQAAFFGLVLLGDTVSLTGLLAMALGVVAVLILTIGKEALRPALWTSVVRDRGAMLGLLAGSCFGIAAICYRGAGLALGSGDFFLRALFTLACVISFQVLLMGLMLAWREPGTLRAVASRWQRGVLVGIAGALASAGWFSSSLLVNAAYVRALGQVEILFALGTAILVFGERPAPREWLGILLLLTSLVLLLVA